MENFAKLKQAFDDDGFTIIANIFSTEEVRSITNFIDAVTTDKSSFRKAKDLFAIRQFLKEIPEIQPLLFTDHLCKIINHFFGSNCFVIKSIYFDKPPESNWFVPFHQDITISVNKKADVNGFSNWTVKQDQFAVQPTPDLLEDNFTIRIHLDDTDKNNGALKVIPSSHTKGIIRPETMDSDFKETICDVAQGGIMLMRPLLFHASGKTINNNWRRVIHVEFSNKTLPPPLQWSEYMYINY